MPTLMDGASLLAAGYLLLTIYLANQQPLNRQRERIVNGLLYAGAALMLLLGVSFVLMALARQHYLSLPESHQVFRAVWGTAISDAARATAAAVELGAGVAAVVVIRRVDARRAIQRVVRRWGTYDPESPVHTTAVVFILMLVAVNTGGYIMAGGASGIAENIENEGISAGAPLAQAGIQVAAALMGVGWLTRRRLPDLRARLGVRLPRGEDLIGSIVTVIGLYLAIIVFGSFVMVLVSPETLEQQNRAAESLVSAFSTLPLALLLSASAAVGEEIFFRGAIQPVFGILPTSIFFALLHSQLLLSPGIVVIFLVGLGTGWARRKYSTTAAIIAHFLYNFSLLLLNMLVDTGGSV